MSSPPPTPPRGTPPISQVIPPLILGTATFNAQYNAQPHLLPSVALISSAISQSITAFDTSPYYGPSETILGDALKHLLNPPASSPYHKIKRDSYFLITKAGRVAGNAFNYSPGAIRQSVERSCERLNTDYLDLVYLHDCEFLSPTHHNVILAAVKTLRALCEEGKIRYIGLSGYPLPTLTLLAELVLKETGEPVDAVMTYGHFTIQNSTLANSSAVERLRKAGVSVVPSASMLGMGLLTTAGIDGGQMKSWHPAPAGLKQAIKNVVLALGKDGLPGVGGKDKMKIETLSLTYALSQWRIAGSSVGTTFSPPLSASAPLPPSQQKAVGISVMGVSSLSELAETVALWEKCRTAATQTDKNDQTKQELEAVKTFVEKGVWPVLGRWKDYSWASPGKGFVNEMEGEQAEGMRLAAEEEVRVGKSKQ